MQNITQYISQSIVRPNFVAYVNFSHRLVAQLLISLFFLVTCNFSYSAELLTIIVPTPPGSAPDLLARKISLLMANNDINFVIQNYPGANGIIATKKFLNSNEKNLIFLAPDSVIVINPLLYKQGYSLQNYSNPIAKIAENEFYLFVRSQDKSINLDDFFNNHQSQIINYGSGGPGSISDIFFERLKNTFKFNMINIPYRSNGDAAIALARGDVDIIASGTAAKSLFQNGMIRPLTRLSKFSSSEMVSVPAISASYPSLSTTPWFAFFASKDISNKAIDIFSNRLREILKTAQNRSMINDLGFNVDYLDGADFLEYLKSQSEYYSSIIQKIE